MRKKLIGLSAFLLVASTIFTGCNIKEKGDQINSYDKQDQFSNINSNSDINTSNSNMNDVTSNLPNASSNVDVNITSNGSNTPTSNSTKPINSNTTTTKSNTTTNNTVKTIKINSASGYQVIEAYDSNGKKVWSYKTKNKYQKGTEGYEFHDCHTNIYFMDYNNTKLVALNRNTGKKLWEKTDYTPAILFRSVVEINGKLYVVGGENALEVINMTNGKTVKRIKEFKDKKGFTYSNFGNITGTTGSNIYIQAQKLSSDNEEDVILEINIIDYSFKVN